MVSPEHVAALAEARRRMPRQVWQQLATRLGESGIPLSPSSIRQATADLLNRDAAWILSEAFETSTKAECSEIAAAMVAVDYLIGSATSATELIWTGPANGRFPVRRVDQVLYDLISTAKQRIVLVTFAAHRVRHLCDHLTEAVQRGVELTLIVESEGESEGQLTIDAIVAFQHVPATRTHIYNWPAGKRERNQAGRPGKLHVKCAIIDAVALIGSSNLTDDAFNRNMELGVVIRETAAVSAIHEHFQELIRRGVLVELGRPAQ